MQDSVAPSVSLNADPSQAARYDRDGDGLPDGMYLAAADPSRVPGGPASGSGCYPTFRVLSGAGYWGENLIPHANEVTIRATVMDRAGNNPAEAMLVAQIDQCPDVPGAVDHAGCPLAARVTVGLDTVTRSGARTHQPLAGILVEGYDPANPGFVAAYGSDPALWPIAAIYQAATGASCATDANGSCTIGGDVTPRPILLIARHADPFTGAAVYESGVIAAAEFDSSGLAQATLGAATCDATSGNCPFGIGRLLK